jgi:hypothetical protein
MLYFSRRSWINWKIKRKKARPLERRRASSARRKPGVNTLAFNFNADKAMDVDCDSNNKFENSESTKDPYDNLDIEINAAPVICVVMCEL